jgi:CheY-like chemotaxis protein
MNSESIPQKSIVVVNDSPDLLELAQLLFEDEGYDVKVALAGTGAFDLIRETHPDLVILDVRMPDISGWDILQAMHLYPETAQIPVRMCSAAVGEMRQLEEQLAAAGVDWLVKPYSIDALLEKVHRLIGDEPPDDMTT